MSVDELDTMAKFEGRMSVVERDNPDMAAASRSVHSMLTNARHVAESVFNDDVADNPDVVMSIMSAIADEIDEIVGRREHAECGGDEEDQDSDYA